MSEPNDTDRDFVIEMRDFFPHDGVADWLGAYALAAQHREQCEAAARADERAKVLAAVEAMARKMSEKPRGMHPASGKERAPPSFTFWVYLLVERLRGVDDGQAQD